MSDRYKVALLMFGVGWGANHFTGLLLLYREEGYSAGTAAAMFGTYALGLVPALACAGPLSDRIGRKRVLWPAVAISALASLVLMAGVSSVGLLFAGRVLAGIATGAAMAAGTPWVRELSAGSGAGIAAIALSAGFGGGPLVSATIAQWLPASLIFPYLVHMLLLALLTLLAFRAKEPAAAASTAGHVPTQVEKREHRLFSVAFLLGVALWAPLVFGAASVSLATVPELPGVQEIFRSTPIFASGLIAGVTMLVGVLVQPVALGINRASRTGATVTGLVLAVAGLAGAALLASPEQQWGWWAPLVVSAILGAAYGFLMVSGLVEVEQMAPAHRHGTFAAAFYALTYCGFAWPYLLALLGQLQPLSIWLLAAAGMVVLIIPVKLLVGHVPRGPAGSS